MSDKNPFDPTKNLSDLFKEQDRYHMELALEASSEGDSEDQALNHLRSIDNNVSQIVHQQREVIDHINRLLERQNKALSLIAGMLS